MTRSIHAVASRRRIAAAGIGVLAGVIAAVVIPSAESTPRDRPFLAPSQSLRIERAATNDRSADQSRLLRVHRGTGHIEARVHDPAGGPDWAIRAFVADQMIPAQLRRPGRSAVGTVSLCAQLGRIVGGKFGWIDASNTFRPVRAASWTVAPWLCGSRQLDRRREPSLNQTVLLDRIDGTGRTEPLVRGSVVWGLTGAAARHLRLDTRGRTLTPAPKGRRGAFLEFFGPNVVVSDARLRVRYAGGGRADTGGDANPIGAPELRLAPGDAIEPSTSQVVARTSDPGGGPSWAMLATRTRKGVWCEGSSGPLIDGHVGTINARLGTLSEQSAWLGPTGCGRGAQPTKRFPVMFGFSSGGHLDPTAGLEPSAGALRLQHGRTVYSGWALPGVDRITLATPRDVRTIIPSGPMHAFIVAYDGDFTSGRTTLAAHFKDGHVWRNVNDNMAF